MGMDIQLKKKSWIKRNSLYAILGSIVLVFITYQLAFADHSSKLNIETDKITIETVNQDLFQDYIAVVGTVEPLQTIYLDATEGGRVEEIFIDEGTMLKKGDVIMRLSNDNLVLEISNNEAQVARTINDLKTMSLTLENQSLDNKNQLIDMHYNLLKLEREYNYNKELVKNDHISKEELDVSREQYERIKKQLALLKQKSRLDSIFMIERIKASEESIERMQSNLSLIRKRLDKLTVRASINGELATLNAEIGEVISYGKRIGTINILDSYKLKVEVDEHYISRVKRNLKGDCDFSNVNYSAVIRKIYPEVVEGRFAVDMELTNGIPEDIRIGQTSRIRLELGESKQAVIIPRGGFYQSTGGQWVFVVDESEEFAYKKDIRIGRQNPKYYEVLEGLEAGERVIVSGYESFGDVEKLMLN